MNSNALFYRLVFANVNKVNNLWQEVQGTFVGKMLHRSFGHTAVTALQGISSVKGECRSEAEIKAGLACLFASATD